MVKPEWGAKHGCPKCGTASTIWARTTRSPASNAASLAVRAGAQVEAADSRIEEVKEKPEDAPTSIWPTRSSDIDEDGDSPDNDVDLGGDDDLGVAGGRR